MAHSKQAKKRIRQNEKAQLANKSKASNMRSTFKKLMSAVAEGDKDSANTLLPQTIKRIDKAAQGNVIHANQAARKKSQAARAVHSLEKA